MGSLKLPASEHDLYRKRLPAIKKSIAFLKKHKPHNLDEVFEETHDEVFKQTQCTSCGNCCKTTSPMLFERDIERLSSHLKLKPGAFVEKYLFLDTDGIYAFKSTPCPFLNHDLHCSVYEHRPKACREYPHTQHRKMQQKLDLATKNMEICPAVLHILSKISTLFPG